MIKVAPYNSNWPVIFDGEAKQIKQALGDNCIKIHHIGSTSVPGLAAKPIIDIIAVVGDMDFPWKFLESIDYIGRGEVNIPFKLFFKKQRTDELLVHLHVYEKWNPEIELNLMFRNYLRENHADREAYSKLKLDLVANKDLHAKNGKSLSGYNLGKDHFIKNILKKADFQKNCIRFCAHDDEWDAAGYFRQKYFDSLGIQDLHICALNHPEHVHFVFYQGIQIVGYSHIEIRDGNSMLRILVIDEKVRGQGLGKYFLSLIERWFRQKQYPFIHVDASLRSYEFYLKQGYLKMTNALNDTERHDEYVSMGKKL